MEKFEEVAVAIVDFLKPNRSLRLLTPSSPGTRFVLCGTSGSGKTRAISAANSKLPSSERIAESQDLLRERDPLKALDVVNDAELAYEASQHIAFNVVSRPLADALELKGVKVFWLDPGSSGSWWNAGAESDT
jgi:hypothetical protein